MAAKNKRSVTVEQMNNPAHDQSKPPDDSNPDHTYHVIRCSNTLTVHIGEYLKPFEVQQLMDLGIDVTIVPVK